MKIILHIGLFVMLLNSCSKGEEAKDRRATNHSNSVSSSKIRETLNGYWVMISQSFTKGRKLESFPVGGTVGIIFTSNDHWYSVTRSLGEKEDTVSHGTFAVKGNKIVMEVEESIDPVSHVRLNGKLSILGRFMQLEGRMIYEGDKRSEYTHVILGRSARTLEDVFKSDNK